MPFLSAADASIRVRGDSYPHICWCGDCVCPQPRPILVVQQVLPTAATVPAAAVPTLGEQQARAAASIVSILAFVTPCPHTGHGQGGMRLGRFGRGVCGVVAEGRRAVWGGFVRAIPRAVGLGVVK